MTTTRFFRVFALLFAFCSVLSLGVTDALGEEGDAPGGLRGVVTSAASEAPLPGANVAVRQASDSTLVDGTTTDSTGHFSVKELPLGSYTVVVSFVGYSTESIGVKLTNSDPTRSLGPVRLTETSAQMEGTTVSAERPFVTTKGSKKIYSFEKSQVALAGKSAVDVMRDLPSLRIDAIDGAIRLRGNQSVSIHVNGQPVAMEGKALVQYLKGLSGADIKRIEVNTNPSARYDAEGTAGIVNIVLDRKEDAGLSGGATASAGFGPRLDGSGNLGYKQGKWTLYGSYSYSHNQRDFVQDLLRRPTDAPDALFLDRTATHLQTYGGHSFNAEIDYALTPATTLSLTSTGNVWQSSGDETTTIQQGDESPPDRRAVASEDRTLHLDERFSVDHEFEKDHMLSADLRYQRRDRSDRIREDQVLSGPREREEETMGEHTGSLKLDYTRPLGAWTVETGYKGSLRHLDQHYDVHRLDTGQLKTDALAFQEQVHAGYGTLQRSVGPIDAEVGLRAEHTQTRIDLDGEATDNNSYLGLYPSASLTYKMGRGRRVSLSYSKRVDRPNAFQLSAFQASSDPYVRFVGNPNLDPEQIHKAELTVLQRLGPATITATPYARRKNDAIEWTTTQKDSVTVRTYDNYDARTSYGLELTSSIPVGAFKATLSGNLYRRLTRGGSLDDGQTRKTVAAMGRANVTWSPLSDLRLQVSQMYRSPMEAGFGRMSAFVRSSLSLEKTFWNDKGTLGLQVEDPFNTSEMELRQRTDRFRERMVNDWEGRTVSISFSYQFGNSDQKKQRQSSSGGGGMGPMGGR